MLQGSILATDRRVHQVGCSGLGGGFSSNKGAIVRSFKKCGISLSIDGSQDSEINISELSALKIQRMKCPRM